MTVSRRDLVVRGLLSVPAVSILGGSPAALAPQVRGASVVHLAITKQGKESALGSLDDPNLAAVCGLLQPLAEADASADVVDDMRDALQQAYGSAVTENIVATLPFYKWGWDPDIMDWVRVCCSDLIEFAISFGKDGTIAVGATLEERI